MDLDEAAVVEVLAEEVAHAGGHLEDGLVGDGLWEKVSVPARCFVDDVERTRRSKTRLSRRVSSATMAPDFGSSGESAASTADRFPSAMVKGSVGGASEMTWICSHAGSALPPPPATHLSQGYLGDLDLGVPDGDGVALDRDRRDLDGTLDENDALVVDALCELDHRPRDEFRLDLDEALDSGGLLPEDEEDHLGACARGRGRSAPVARSREETDPGHARSGAGHGR